MAWIRSVYSFSREVFFGCNHEHLTRPFTLQAHSYKVCLDCGRELPYSIEKMRLLHPGEREGFQPRFHTLQPQFAEMKVVSATPRLSRHHSFAEVEDPQDSRAIA